MGEDIRVYCSALDCISYGIHSNSLVEGDDYNAGPHTVQFTDLGVSLPTQQCTSIGTIDDDDVEGPHYFTVEIASVTLPSSVSIESPSQQSATINDNDSM